MADPTPGQIGTGSLTGGLGGGQVLGWLWQGWLVPAGAPDMPGEIAAILAGGMVAAVMGWSRVRRRFGPRPANEA